MKIERIRQAKHAQPFVPFELIMKDGRNVRVAAAIAIALSPVGKSVAGFDENGRPFYLPLADMSKLRRSGSRSASRRRNGNDV